MAELEFGLANVHGEPVKVPAPLLVNDTVPVGALGVPGEASCTPTVQVVGVSTVTKKGVQAMFVLVVRLLTVTVKGVVVELPV